VAGNNHAGNARCSGAARRATGAFAALLRLLQQHTAYAVLEALLCAVRWLKERCSLHQVLHFTRGKKLNTAGGRARVEFDERTDAECAHASAAFLEFSQRKFTLTAQTL